jgi:hypothetical protein
MRRCGEGHYSKDIRLVGMFGKILDQSGEVHEKDCKRLNHENITKRFQKEGATES